MLSSRNSLSSGGIVRKSNFRHMAGHLWPKSQTHENIQLGIGQSLSDYIQTDGLHFALPYSMPGGVLAYRKVMDFGRWPSDIDQLDSNFIVAHQKPISDFKFSPFELYDSNGKRFSLLATASADECVKLWKIAYNEQMSSYCKICEPEAVLSNTDKSYGLIHNIRFHPRVQNLILSTQLSLARFWDQNVSKPLLDIRLEDNIYIITADFFSSQPYLFSASCSDRSVRIWDVRTPDKPINLTNNVHTNGGKPFSVKCIEHKGKSLIFSVGFSKTGSREFATFDIRKGSIIQESDYLQRTTIDQISSVISPFWDEDTSVMYLAGKGDANIRYYELDGENNKFEYLTEYIPDTSEPPASQPQKSIDIFPKLVCDVNKFEVNRFVKLTNDNCVKVISFKVSRNKNIAHYFQEDIYPATWNRKPVTNKPEEWKNKKLKEKYRKKELGVKSLKPDDKISIYDVSVDKGGKARPEPDKNELTEEEWKEYQEKSKSEASAPIPPTPRYSLGNGEGSTVASIPPVQHPTFLPPPAVEQDTITTTEKELNSPLISKVTLMCLGSFEIAHLLGGKFFFYYLLIAVPFMFLFFKFFAHRKVSVVKSVSVFDEAIIAPDKPQEHTHPSLNQKQDTSLKQDLGTSPLRLKKVPSSSDTPSPTPRPLSTPREFVSRLETTRELSALLSDCVVTEEDLKMKAHEVDKTCAAHQIDITFVKQGKQPLLFYVRGRVQRRASLVPTHYSSMFHLDNCSFVLDCGKTIFRYDLPGANRFTTTFARDIADEIKAKERGGTATVLLYEQGKKPEKDIEKKLQHNFWKALGCSSEEHFLELQAKHLEQIGQKKKDELLARLSQNDDNLYSLLVDKSINLYRVNTELLNYEEEQAKLRAQQKLPDPETAQQWIDRVKPSILINVNWEKEKMQPSHKVLLSDSCYILETKYPSCEVYCWQGNKSHKASRTWALVLARKIAHLRIKPSQGCIFKKPNSSDSFSTVTHVIEGAEHVLFKKKFYDFGETPFSKPKPVPPPTPRLEQKEINIADLLNHRKSLKATTSTEQLYNEKVKMWRIQDNDKIAYEDIGNFYSNDSYIVLHTYEKIKNGRPTHTIYFWLGRNSAKKVMGTSALKTVEISDMISGKEGATGTDTGVVEHQVRVVQSEEPPQFLRLFLSGFVVYRGHYHLREQQKSKQNVLLFDVRATDDYVVHFTECDYVSTTYLSGRNMAVLVDIKANKIFMWIGAGAPTECVQNSEKLIKSKLIPHLNLDSSTDTTIIKEGSEGSNFWDYFQSNMRTVVKQNVGTEPYRMFAITGETGVFTCTEVFPISQEALQSEKIYLLDANTVYGSIFLWIGKLSSANEKFAAELAMKYADFLKIPKDKQYVVYEFNEPVEFRLLFDAWSESSISSKDRKRVLKEKNMSSAITTDYFSRIATLAECKKIDDLLNRYSKKYYSYEELLNREGIPFVDTAVLEDYLSDDYFQKLFQMSREEFKRVPSWKKAEMKKKVNLF